MKRSKTHKRNTELGIHTSFCKDGGLNAKRQAMADGANYLYIEKELLFILLNTPKNLLDVRPRRYDMLTGYS